MGSVPFQKSKRFTACVDDNVLVPVADPGWNYLANTTEITGLALARMRWSAPWLHGATASLALAWQSQITWSCYGTLH